ncbi:MAG: hydantoinase/oxoprolinase N-terminal domain-containing protein, partial [Omnitrophica WOR_2 bacterium]
MYIGIDTGGTFTDGVLLDPASQQVVKSDKVLTTHQDLTLCIREILDRILPEDPASVTLVSLSTTLATNAIAEGKRRPVALLLLGYDPALVHQYGFDRQFGTRQYYFIPGRHGLNGIEQIPLDEAGVEKIALDVHDKVDAFSVASYAGPVNASHEERAAAILAKTTKLPVVQAHHLSSELDSIRRATTASLNASLLDKLQDFLDAVERMLEGKGVHCPVMMVRGDGSIAKSDFARSRPVEIIHSGPATSAIGGQFLSGVDTALVVDIGGTTTDIAMVEKGKIQILENGATVGNHRTCVRTVKVHSFALGGDSAISFDHYQTLEIGPERLIPLSHLCSLYPDVKQDLLTWIRTRRQVRYSEDLEYWSLRRKPPRSLQNERIDKILGLLESGPKRLTWLKAQAGALAPVVVRELVNEEI